VLVARSLPAAIPIDAAPFACSTSPSADVFVALCVAAAPASAAFWSAMLCAVDWTCVAASAAACVCCRNWFVWLALTPTA
jgi:hypothetical protein